MIMEEYSINWKFRKVWKSWFGLGEWKSIYHFIPVFPIFISFYTPCFTYVMSYKYSYMSFRRYKEVNKTVYTYIHIIPSSI